MILGKLCMETMRLESITRIIQPITTRGPLNVDIEGIAYDSRQVREGYLFVALQGQHANGAQYIEDAIRRGATAVVSEDDQWARRDIAHIRVEDARLALAEISCAFYDKPSERIELIGITGTNGKTTTSYMCRDILWAAGRPTGLVGTIRYEIGKRIIPATRTTPEAPDVQFMLDQMVRSGCRNAVMEVSSHALHQRRVWGTDFDVGVFTNLTRDHLDYHKSMNEYFAAKTVLFRGLGQQEKNAEAEAMLRQAMADDPADISAAQQLGQLLRSTKDFTGAAKAYTTAIERLGDLEPEDWQLFYYRGIAYERAKDWPSAEKDFLKALELSPDEPYVLNYLAYTWVERRENLDKALPMLEKAVQQRPEEGFIVDSLGWAHFKLGNYEKAVVNLEKAVKLAPTDPVLNDHLGDAYWRVGRHHEARFQWSRALSFEPEPELKPVIEKKLEEGLPDQSANPAPAGSPTAGTSNGG